MRNIVIDVLPRMRGVSVWERLDIMPLLVFAGSPRRKGAADSLVRVMREVLHFGPVSSKWMCPPSCRRDTSS
jgi:hypothetical protein